MTGSRSRTERGLAICRPSGCGGAERREAPRWREAGGSRGGDRAESQRARRKGQENAEQKMPGLGPQQGGDSPEHLSPGDTEPRAPGSLVYITQLSEFKCWDPCSPGKLLVEGREGRGGEGRGGAQHCSLGWLEGPRRPADRLAWPARLACQRVRYQGSEIM